MLEIADLNKKLEPAAYRRIFPKLQEKLRGLQYAVRDAEIATVIALEGWDGSGRGNIIKHLVSRLDPRLFRIYPGTPPSPLEQRHHFLWRYQVNLPNDGEIALFDHSWYGRVLVERMDKLVPKKDWREAYEQINQFERWLADDGQVLVKFWLHISKKEQKKRFKEFKQDPALAYKVTKEYKRHHKQYNKWVAAVEEMLQKTDSPHAPWTIVEAEDLRWARVKVFQTLIDRIEKALARRKAAPAAVSRTVAALEATKVKRARKAAADSALAKSQARKEGLPMEEERKKAKGKR
jgi:polyphosphate kinase 2 (PPK2 family)